MTQQQYWLQEQQVAGNWVDYIGMDPRTTLEQAVADFKATSKFMGSKKMGERKVRLVVRFDAVLMGGK